MTLRTFFSRYWSLRPGPGDVIALTLLTIAFMLVFGWPAWVSVLAAVTLFALSMAVFAALELANDAASPAAAPVTPAGPAAPAQESNEPEAPAGTAFAVDEPDAAHYVHLRPGDGES
ncbi:hypothetical protein [Streptosporangium roseum]|uniref:hypothetical protein n=1 Tax=Streptosporangium roseum TaxID=2001 RepID=UPI0012DD3AB1|nr:hypothetical protein [Streptosporangium roseum]